MLYDNILDSKSKLKVIRELALHPDWEYTMTELADKTGIHRVALSRLISQFLDLDVIYAREKGKIKLIKINKDNLLVERLIVEFFNEESNIIIDIIKKNLAGIIKDENIISISLAGSAAKGTNKFSSDLDIVIVKKAAKPCEKISELQERLAKKGLRAMIIQLIKGDTDKTDPVIKDIIRNNINLAGKKILEVI